MWPLWKRAPWERPVHPLDAMLVRKQKFNDRVNSLPFTGVCDIREHTGDGAFVGRCYYSKYDEICPRHGLIEMYPNRDDREVKVENRIFERE